MLAPMACAIRWRKHGRQVTEVERKRSEAEGRRQRRGAASAKSKQDSFSKTAQNTAKIAPKGKR
jgi:hypothetical protein